VTSGRGGQGRDAISLHARLALAGLRAFDREQDPGTRIANIKQLCPSPMGRAFMLVGALLLAHGRNTLTGRYRSEKCRELAVLLAGTAAALSFVRLGDGAGQLLPTMSRGTP
jgi:hypothetical protein